MGDRVSLGAGDTATLHETLNDATGDLTPDAITGGVTLTVWRCGTPTPIIAAATATVDGAAPGGGVEVHAPLTPDDTHPISRGLYLARWHATLIDGQILSFPSDEYTTIKVT